MSLVPGSEAWAKHYFGDPGIPGSAQGAQFAAKNIVVCNIFDRDIRVHKDAQRAFKHLSLIFKHHNPNYWKAVNEGTYDDWGFSHRFIAGTSVLSNHSFGTATDIDATKNPRTSDPDETKSYIWRQARESILRVEDIGFMRWGGRYSSPDPMHFELIKTPEWIKLHFDKDGRRK